MSSNCECKLFLAEDFSLAISKFQRSLEQLKSYLSERGIDFNYNLAIKDNCEEAVKINPMDFQAIIIDSELFKSSTNREKESCGLRIVNSITERVRNRRVKIIYWTTEADLDLLRENVLFVKKELTIESLKRMIRWLCSQKFQNNELPGEWGTGKRVGQPERMRAFSLLKHRIAHLWLPLDIDLQGIMECWNDESKDAACKYLEDVLEDKRDKTKDQNNILTYAYYRQKLADLQYIITSSEFGIQGSELNDPCSKDATPVSCSKEVKEFMNGKESVLELIEKLKKEMNENKIEELKQTLIALAGLKTNNEPQGTKHEPNPNSPILKFMCLMDCKIKEKRYNNVEEILNFFQHHKFLDEKGNERQFCMGNIEKPIESFHDWFCALDDCLKNLRMKL